MVRHPLRRSEHVRTPQPGNPTQSPTQGDAMLLGSVLIHTRNRPAGASYAPAPRHLAALRLSHANVTDRQRQRLEGCASVHAVCASCQRN